MSSHIDPTALAAAKYVRKFNPCVRKMGDASLAVYCHAIAHNVTPAQALAMMVAERKKKIVKLISVPTKPPEWLDEFANFSGDDLSSAWDEFVEDFYQAPASFFNEQPRTNDMGEFDAGIEVDERAQLFWSRFCEAMEENFFGNGMIFRLVERAEAAGNLELVLALWKLADIHRALHHSNLNEEFPELVFGATADWDEWQAHCTAVTEKCRAADPTGAFGLWFDLSDLLYCWDGGAHQLAADDGSAFRIGITNKDLMRIRAERQITAFGLP